MGPEGRNDIELTCVVRKGVGKNAALSFALSDFQGCVCNHEARVWAFIYLLM